MNTKRLQTLINILKRAEARGDKLSMDSWQDGQYDDDVLVHATEKKAHECGTACCVAGWLAISPEFKRAGGKVNKSSGEPIYKEVCGPEAIDAYLEATNQEGILIAGYTPTSFGRLYDGWDNKFYKIKDLDNLTLPKAIKRLEKLLETGV